MMVSTQKEPITITRSGTARTIRVASRAPIRPPSPTSATIAPTAAELPPACRTRTMSTSSMASHVKLLATAVRRIELYEAAMCCETGVCEPASTSS